MPLTNCTAQFVLDLIRNAEIEFFLKWLLYIWSIECYTSELRTHQLSNQQPFQNLDFINVDKVHVHYETWPMQYTEIFFQKQTLKISLEKF